MKFSVQYNQSLIFIETELFLFTSKKKALKHTLRKVVLKKDDLLTTEIDMRKMPRCVTKNTNHVVTVHLKFW